MGRLKLTDEEQATHFRRRAAELSQKAKLRVVVATMKKHPHCINEVIQCLVDLGLLQSDDDLASDTIPIKTGGESGPSGFVCSRMLAAVKRRQESLSGQIADISEMAAGDAGSVPSTYYSLGSLSPSLLMTKILPVVDPRAFSCANMKVLGVNGKGKYQLRDELLQLVEFGTGLTGSYPLHGNEHKWDVLQALLRSRVLRRGEANPPFETALGCCSGFGKTAV